MLVYGVVNPRLLNLIPTLMDEAIRQAYAKKGPAVLIISKDPWLAKDRRQFPCNLPKPRKAKLCCSN